MGAIRRPLPNRQRRRMSIEVMVWLRIEKGVLSLTIPKKLVQPS
jgi:hypothetical protein